MLSTLLDKLGSLLPKYFVLSFFFPTLCFAFLNAGVLYFTSQAFREIPDVAALKAGFMFSVALVAILVIAYIVSSVAALLRETLEGKHLPTLLSDRMRCAETQRYLRTLADHAKARKERALISESAPQWQQSFTLASRVGLDSKNAEVYKSDNPTSKIIETFRKKRLRGERISYDELTNAASLLDTSLRTFNKLLPSGIAPSQLDTDQAELVSLAGYARDAALVAELAALHELQFTFGISAVLPTRLGNIAASMQGYTMTRYQLDLDTFWGRIQTVAQNDNKYLGPLLDSKAQLDFLITSWWLAASSVVGWLVTLGTAGYSSIQFVVVGLVGALLCWLLYWLTVASYSAFADSVRTTVDLYRFDVLTALHVPRPKTLQEERALWGNLQRSYAFGEPQVDLTYDGPAS